MHLRSDHRPRPTLRPAAPIGAASLILAFLSLACADEEPAPHRVVIGEKALMSWIVEPAADVYWDAVGDVLELVDGEVVESHFEPTTSKEWTAVRNAAAVIAESGNLLLMGERWRDQGQWQELSQQLIDEHYKHDWRPGCGLRLGPHFYNTEQDVHRFMDRVVELARP